VNGTCRAAVLVAGAATVEGEGCGKRYVDGDRFRAVRSSRVQENAVLTRQRGVRQLPAKPFC